MNTPRILTGILFLAALTVVGAASKTKVKPKPDVLVVADAMTKEGDPSLRPEPGKPIYYFVLGKMERDLGSPMGGMKSPDPAIVHRELTSAMASQGYIETKLGGPMPSIVLLITWGQANLSTQDITESVDSTDANSGETTTSDVTSTIAFNSREMIQLTGANKLGNRLLSSSEAQELNENINSDRVYIFVGALDAKALLKKERKLLWRTRISIDSLRDDLPENLHVMFADAAPYFGRNEDLPITVNEDVRRTSVKLGEIKYLDETPAKPETGQQK